MEFTLLAAYLLSVLLLLMTPGPVVALVTHTALREGNRRAWMTVAGTNIGSLGLIAMATLLLSGVVSLHPLALPVVSIGGSLFLGAMAIQMLRHSHEQTNGSRQRGGFTTGFITAIANPKDILFFAAFFPQFIHVTPHFSLSIGLLTLCWVVLDLLILSLWIISVRRYLPGRYARAVNLATGLFLLAVAISGLIVNLRGLS